jgi:hypothetical protein
MIFDHGPRARHFRPAARRGDSGGYFPVCEPAHYQTGRAVACSERSAAGQLAGPLGAAKHSKDGDGIMKIPALKYLAAFGLRRSIGFIVAAVLTVAAVGGWASSTMSRTNAVKVEPVAPPFTLGNGHYQQPVLW